jgi:ribose 5-phosphate isomerase B
MFYIASDHAGFEVKEFIKELLIKEGLQVTDLGPNNNNRVDYPDFAKPLCQNVLKHNAKGILICGTGLGMSMSANRFQGIRAALCHNEYSAVLSREHNDSNVLCLGARVTGLGVIESIVKLWINTEFAKGRHSNRVEKLDLLSSCGV